MKKLLFLLPIVLMSCSSFVDERHFFIEPELKVYYNEFIQEAKSRGLDVEPASISMTYKDLTKSGRCGLTVYETSSVYIDSSSVCWDIDKRELIFHELGHFLLKRGHDNTVINGKIKSIMIGEGYIINLDKNKKYYYDELFTQYAQQ